MAINVKKQKTKNKKTIQAGVELIIEIHGKKMRRKVTYGFYFSAKKDSQ